LNFVVVVFVHLSTLETPTYKENMFMAVIRCIVYDFVPEAAHKTGTPEAKIKF
jgi:hypothetical protein